MKFGLVVPEIFMQTDRQTDRQIDMLIIMLCSPAVAGVTTNSLCCGIMLIKGISCYL